MELTFLPPKPGTPPCRESLPISCLSRTSVVEALSEPPPPILISSSRAHSTKKKAFFLRSGCPRGLYLSLSLSCARRPAQGPPLLTHRNCVLPGLFTTLASPPCGRLPSPASRLLDNAKAPPTPPGNPTDLHFSFQVLICLGFLQSCSHKRRASFHRTECSVLPSLFPEGLCSPLLRSPPPRSTKFSQAYGHPPRDRDGRPPRF